MKIFIVILGTIFSVATFAAQSNSNLIEKEILGQRFCYLENSGAGWVFYKDGSAINHAINLGMPGPNSYFQLKFFESARSYGHFDLVNGDRKLHFQLTPELTLIEYQTGKKLSVEACDI